MLTARRPCGAVAARIGGSEAGGAEPIRRTKRPRAAHSSRRCPPWDPMRSVRAEPPTVASRHRETIRSHLETGEPALEESGPTTGAASAPHPWKRRRPAAQKSKPLSSRGVLRRRLTTRPTRPAPRGAMAQGGEGPAVAEGYGGHGAVWHGAATRRAATDPVPCKGAVVGTATRTGSPMSSPSRCPLPCLRRAEAPPPRRYREGKGAGLGVSGEGPAGNRDCRACHPPPGTMCLSPVSPTPMFSSRCMIQETRAFPRRCFSSALVSPRS